FGESGVSAVVLARSRHQASWSGHDERDLLRLWPTLAAFHRRLARWRDGSRCDGAEDSGPRIAFDLAGRVRWGSDEAAALLGAGGGVVVPDALVAAARRLGAIAKDPVVPGAVESEIEVAAGGRRLKAGLRLVRSARLAQRFVLVRL